MPLLALMFDRGASKIQDVALDSPRATAAVAGAGTVAAVGIATTLAFSPMPPTTPATTPDGRGTPPPAAATRIRQPDGVTEAVRSRPEAASRTQWPALDAGP
ncbi:hypothetical protein [Nonomuraea bangladeshensis]|uniref:hypothetical protein n=1 Tax=Nonomuraea bangladeshensis TaxID=404385 RepID=UPI003C30C2AE